MDAPTQPCVSQQQTEEMTATSTPSQTETSGESDCNPSVGKKRKAERSAESGQEQNSLSNQPPAKRQHVENSAAATQSFENDTAQSKQTHAKSTQAYVHNCSPHLFVCPLLETIVPSFVGFIFSLTEKLCDFRMKRVRIYKSEKQVLKCIRSGQLFKIAPTITTLNLESIKY